MKSDSKAKGKVCATVPDAINLIVCAPLVLGSRGTACQEARAAHSYAKIPNRKRLRWLICESRVHRLVACQRVVRKFRRPRWVLHTSNSMGKGRPLDCPARTHLTRTDCRRRWPPGGLTQQGLRFYSTAGHRGVAHQTAHRINNHK